MPRKINKLSSSVEERRAHSSSVARKRATQTLKDAVQTVSSITKTIAEKFGQVGVGFFLPLFTLPEHQP